MTRSISTTICFLQVLSAGCATTAQHPSEASAIRFRPTNPLPHPVTPLAPEAVELHTVQPLAHDFVDVGVFSLSDLALRSNGDREAEVAQLLQRAGAERGCNSVVIHGRYLDSSTFLGGLFDAYVYTATCLVYR